MAQRTVMQGLLSRIAVGVFGLLTVAMLLLAVFDERGALAVRERRLEKERLQQEVQKVIEENERARQDIKSLNHDPRTIERRAREDFKLVKPGEIVLELPSVPENDPTATKSSSAEQNQGLLSPVAIGVFGLLTLATLLLAIFHWRSSPKTLER